jgi:hypothetical protein
VFGRKLLTAMVAAAEDAGGTVVAADTDGLIVATEEPERVLNAVTTAPPDPFKVSVEWSGCTVFVSDPKNYLTLGPEGELVEVKGAKWRGSDREALWTKIPLEFLRRLTVEGPDSAFEYAREVKQRIESGNAWELVTRSHRVSGADKTLLTAGFREGELASYTYKRFGSNRREISRSPEEGYDIHHYTNVLARIVGEIAGVCGLEVPDDLHPTKRTKREARVALAPGIADGLGGGDSEVKLENAVKFLKDILGRGPVPVEEIFEKAIEQGFSERTLRRARSALGVKSQRRNGKWWWSLSDSAEERVESDDLLRAPGAAAVGPGKDLEDDAASGDPVTELPHLEGVASEEPQVEGSQLGPGTPDDANPRALVARLARVSPGPHHHVGEWTLGLCPACGKRTVAWRFHPPEVVSICGCSVAPGLVRADRLPVEPVTIR